MEIAIHNVKSVYLKDIHTYEKDVKARHDTFYTRVLIVKDAQGAELELTLFTDNKNVLSF